MAIIVIDARAKLNQSSDIVELELSRGSRNAEMTARRDWTLQELAENILAQNFPDDPDRTFQRRIIIDAHQETEIDPDTQEEYLVWIIDDVSTEQLPDEAAQDGIDSLPGWATWTAQEADDWILNNVTNLDSAVTALRAMARMIVHLRDRG